MRLDPFLDCHACGRSVIGATGVASSDEWKRCTRCGRLWVCDACGQAVADVCDCCRECGALEDLHDGGRCAGCCTAAVCA